MFSIKALALTTAISAGVVFAMPATSEAAKVKSTVHVQTGSQSNLQKKKSASWWRRHCAVSNDVKCGRRYTRKHSERRYYGHYKPYRHKSGVSVKVY